MIRKFIKWSLLAVLAFALVVSLSIGIYFIYPDVAKLRKTNPAKTAFMEYREKEWTKKGEKKKVQKIWVPLTRISPYVVKAVLIAEDDKFWDHEGFDFNAIQKAIEEDIKRRRFRVGGSTVTQQLAKNLYLSPSKNPVRKLKEAVLTWRMERNLSKKRIIELYLNVAEWGDGIFGIEMAARRYYGKPAAGLSAEEAARLASVLPNPIKYSPAGSSGYVSSRSRKIFNIMVRRGIVIREYEEIMKEPDEKPAEEQEKPEAAVNEETKDPDGKQATPPEPGRKEELKKHNKNEEPEKEKITDTQKDSS